MIWWRVGGGAGAAVCQMSTDSFRLRFQSPLSRLPGPFGPAFGKGLLFMFPGNNGRIACYLYKLSRTPP